MQLGFQLLLGTHQQDNILAEAFNPDVLFVLTLDILQLYILL